MPEDIAPKTPIAQLAREIAQLEELLANLTAREEEEAAADQHYSEAVNNARLDWEKAQLAASNAGEHYQKTQDRHREHQRQVQVNRAKIQAEREKAQKDLNEKVAALPGLLSKTTTAAPAPAVIASTPLPVSRVVSTAVMVITPPVADITATPATFTPAPAPAPDTLPLPSVPIEPQEPVFSGKVGDIWYAKTNNLRFQETAYIRLVDMGKGKPLFQGYTETGQPKRLAPHSPQYLNQGYCRTLEEADLHDTYYLRRAPKSLWCDLPYPKDGEPATFMLRVIDLRIIDALGRRAPLIDASYMTKRAQKKEVIDPLSRKVSMNTHREEVCLLGLGYQYYGVKDDQNGNPLGFPASATKTRLAIHSTGPNKLFRQTRVAPDEVMGGTWELTPLGKAILDKMREENFGV